MMGIPGGTYCRNHRENFRFILRFLFLIPALLAGFSILIAGLSQAQGSPPESTPIKSGCEYDYPPYCVVNEEGAAGGFSVELLRSALKAMGREVEFTVGPWNEIKEGLAEGKLEALPLVGRTREREEIFDFTFPYLTMHGAIVVRAGETGIEGLEDLRGKEVAVLRGDNAAEFLFRNGFEEEVVSTETFADALKELAAGEHDAVFIQRLVGLQIIDRLGLDNLRIIPLSREQFRQSFCFAVREGNNTLLEILNEGLSIVMADDTYRRLWYHWFGPIESLSRQPVAVGGDWNYPPYEFLDKNGSPAGFNVDLIRAVAEVLGMKIKLRLGPWEEIKNELAGGKIDVIMGMLYTPERAANYLLSSPHTFINQVIVTRKDSEPINRLDDLKGKKILVEAGDVMEELASDHGYKDQLIPVETQEEALRRLSRGEGDCALTARLSAMITIGKYGWDNLKIADQSVTSGGYCLAVSKDNLQLLNRLAAGLAEVRETGRYREITSKWFGVYEKPRFRQVLKYILIILVPVLFALTLIMIWNRTLRKSVRERTERLSASNQQLVASNSALEQSEEKYRTLVESSLQGVMILQADPARLHFANAAMESISGYHVEELLSMGPSKLSGLIHADDRARFFDSFKRLVAGDAVPPVAEYRIRRKDGATSWALCYSSIINYFGERAILTTLVDVTKHKRADSRFQIAQDMSPDGFTILHPERDASGQIVDFTWLYENAAVARLNGTDPQTVVGKRLLDMFPGHGDTQLFSAYQRVAETGEPCTFEIMYSGESMPRPTWLRIVVVPMDGEIAILAQDITERKHTEEEVLSANQQLQGANQQLQAANQQLQANEQQLQALNQQLRANEQQLQASNQQLRANEQQIQSSNQQLRAEIEERKSFAAALKKSRARFQRAIEDAPFPIIIHAEDGEVITINKIWTEITGYTQEDIPTIDVWTEKAYGEKKSLVRADIDALYKLEGRREEGEYRIRTKSGEERIWSFSSAPLDELSGDRRVVISIGTDITEEKRNLQRIRELSRFPDENPDPVMRIDRSGQILYANNSSGMILDEWKSKEGENAPPDWCRRIGEVLTRGVSEEMELEFSGRICLLSLVPIPGEGYCNIYARDMTELYQNREELQKIERLSSLGVLAGGIAHDFNNLLTAIIGNLSLLNQGETDRAEFREIVNEALTASTTARSLTKQLLIFARGGDPLRVVSPVGNLIREAAGFVLRGSNVRAEYRISPDLNHAEVDEGQIKQVIQNLVINSDQAMPEGGTITIKAENVEMEVAYGFLAAGKYIRIELADRGVGIGPEQLNKIFDPYFSTKQKGSGLGLAIVDSIIRKHGGRIEVKSKVGFGTTFIIYLPAVEGRAKPKEKIEAVLPAPERSGRILIMDDQEEVIRVAERIVTRAGWEVITASEGAEAVKLYSEALASGDTFQAVILDLTVPGEMGGREAAEKILELNPEAILIVSSGYSNDLVVANFQDYGFKGVVTKPYLPSQLIRELERLL